MTDGVIYTLTVRGVSDRAAPPNTIPEATAATFVFTALPAGGLAHHWSFDEGSGTTARDGVGGIDGALESAAWAPEGVRFAALDCSGASRVALGAPDLGGSAATFSLWFRHRVAQTSVDPRLISKSTSTAEESHYWMVSLTAVGGEERLRFRLKTGASTTTLIASSGAVPLGRWVHAAAVYDGGAMRLFLDGQPVGDTAKSGALAVSNSVQAAIGNQPQGAGTNGFDGEIDEVRIYNRALSQAEINALVDGTSPPRFHTWVAGFGLAGPAAEPSADPDMDGLDNAAEYAFGENPIVAGAPQLGALTVSTPEADEHLAVQFPLVKTAADVTCRIEISEDLVTWIPAGAFIPNGSGAGYTASPHSATFSQTDQGATLLIIERENLNGNSTRRFARVAVTLEL
jgi:hypothetical protein